MLFKYTAELSTVDITPTKYIYNIQMVNYIIKWSLKLGLNNNLKSQSNQNKLPLATLSKIEQSVKRSLAN